LPEGGVERRGFPGTVCDDQAITGETMNWLDNLLPPQIKQTDPKRRKSIPEGLWLKCPECEAVLYRTDVEANLFVCPKCGYHMSIGARERLDHLLDAEGRYEIGHQVLPVDPLTFRDSRAYPERLSEAMEETGETDAVVVMGGAIHSIPAVVACFDFSFMAGSMGSVVGERFVRGVRNAIEQRTPFICIAASGGARMQESVYSLMQMAKTTAILTRLAEAGLPFISVLTHPTTGGVSASFAFLGDVVMAEPKALIAFTGERVIEQTVRETLPEGYQRPEFLLQRGAIDMIVDRRNMREEVARLMAILTRQPSDSIG
jgi:acetyl-CoA carboxylase carboxyl transferase subunit beta